MIIIYFITFALILAFFLIEGFLRKGDDAKTLKRTKYDKGSTTWLGFAFILSYLIIIVTPIFNHYNKIGEIGNVLIINILGLLIMISGIAIRITAVFTLGEILYAYIAGDR